jgi:hypothetical protein
VILHIVDLNQVWAANYKVLSIWAKANRDNLLGVVNAGQKLLGSQVKGANLGVMTGKHEAIVRCKGHIYVYFIFLRETLSFKISHMFVFL